MNATLNGRRMVKVSISEEIVRKLRVTAKVLCTGGVPLVIWQGDTQCVFVDPEDVPVWTDAGSVVVDGEVN